MRMGVYIPVEAVFPDVCSDFATFRSLLRGLSLTDTLFWCAQINMILSHASEDGHEKRQGDVLTRHFTREEFDRANRFATENGGTEGVAAFFRGQLLELMRWATLYCHDHPDDGAADDNPATRRRFAQAALIASEIWCRRVFGNRIPRVGDGLAEGRRKLMGAIRKSAEAAMRADAIQRALGRGWALFSEYYPRQHVTFNLEFSRLTGMSFDEYYACLSVLMFYMCPADREPIFHCERFCEQTAYIEHFRTFLALESQTPEDMRIALWGQTPPQMDDDADAPSYDYGPLRERPILRSRAGHGVILDPPLYTAKASVGPLFTVTRGNPRKANEHFGAFGLAFEEYACDILRRIYPEGSGVLAKRLFCNVEGIDQSGKQVQVDACLNDVTELVLFEMKAVFIPEHTILTDDHAALGQRLREKYGATAGGGGDRKVKGVGQLARIVNLLATKQWLGPGNLFSQVELVYPVLVAHDPFVGAPFWQDFLASEFRALLVPDDGPAAGVMVKHDLRVAPLIVMGIDDLENLEPLADSVGLRDLLRDYSRSDPQRLGSFKDFMVSRFREQGIRLSSYLTDKAVDFLQSAKNALFPQ